MREKLIRKGSALTLDKAVELARSLEASQHNYLPWRAVALITLRNRFSWSKNKTRGKDQREPNHQIFNPKEEHGYAETVVAPTIHSLTAEHVVRHVSTAKNQATLLTSVDQNPKDNDFTL